MATAKKRTTNTAAAKTAAKKTTTGKGAKPAPKAGAKKPARTATDTKNKAAANTAAKKATAAKTETKKAAKMAAKKKAAAQTAAKKATGKSAKRAAAAKTADKTVKKSAKKIADKAAKKAAKKSASKSDQTATQQAGKKAAGKKAAGKKAARQKAAGKKAAGKQAAGKQAKPKKDRAAKSMAKRAAQVSAALFGPLTEGERAAALRILTEDARLDSMAKVGRYRVITVEPLAVKPPHRLAGNRLARVLVYDYAADSSVDGCVDLDQSQVAHLKISRAQPMLAREEEAAAIAIALSDEQVKEQLSLGDEPQVAMHYWGSKGTSLSYARRSAAVIFGRPNSSPSLIAVVDLLDNLVCEIVPATQW